MRAVSDNQARPRILHLSSERGWRGGEIQLDLLLQGLARTADNTLFACRSSELAERCDAAEKIILNGMGFLRFRDMLTLRGCMRTGAPPILHAHSGKALETALLARAGTGARIVVSRRTAYPVRSGWKYRMADQVIAVSEAARRELLKRGVLPERIHVVPDAVDAARIPDDLPAESRGSTKRTAVLCAAAFAAEKDHAMLLRAWKKVEARCEAELLLAGDGPLKGVAEEQAGRLGLRSVRFLGWQADIAGLIATTDLAVLPSRNEGLSSFLCEAQWCGKALVATDAGGISDVVAHGETGLLSPVGDADALAENLVRLIEDPLLRAAFGREGMGRARRKYALEAVVEAHLGIYRSLLSR